ncbi:MAG: EAL domain-containing protein [Rhodopseudomonas sp.]|nr:EAL domain-containing protein [Rhodopseudomonas sp.]
MTETHGPLSDVPDAPPLAADTAPLCYVADDDASIRQFLSLVLHGAGVDTQEFPEGTDLRHAVARRTPHIVFLNISLDAADAIETVIELGRIRFRGRILLMSARGAAVLSHVKNIGLQHGLAMLPVLKKPFETDAVVKVLRDLKLGTLPGVNATLDLDEAITNGWVEFWYQPKIDLRRKQLAGAEAYVRVRHPLYGIALPSAFMPDASESGLLTLSEMALTDALQAGLTFSKLGVNLKLTVNIPVPALQQLPVTDIVRKYRPQASKWAGLIIDVPEEQIVRDLALATSLSNRLERYNVRLAIDDFGRGMSSLARLGAMPFAELKLDRDFVADCGSDKVNAPLCKTVIDLAHNFGRVAVAMGIEKAADSLALVSMGCDYGQGFLLGQPMPAERFVSLLRQRASTHRRRNAGTITQS